LRRGSGIAKLRETPYGIMVFRDGELIDWGFYSNQTQLSWTINFALEKYPKDEIWIIRATKVREKGKR